MSDQELRERLKEMWLELPTIPEGGNINPEKGVKVLRFHVIFQALCHELFGTDVPDWLS